MLIVFEAKEEEQCRYLYRPYGRVDRTKLKSKLLQRCVEHGGHLQLVLQPNMPCT